jgi:ribosomal protein L11 methyltransferase
MPATQTLQLEAPNQAQQDGVYFRSMQTDPPPLLVPLQRLNDFSDRLPRGGTTAAAVILLSVAVLLDWQPVGASIAFPLYYLIPICILAWFVGWLPTLASTLIAAAISSVGLYLSSKQVPFALLFVLGRILTLTLSLLIARTAATIRLMIDFYLLGDQVREHIVPIRIGARLVSIPTRDADIRKFQSRLGTGDIPLLIRPGMAFGSGSHATTQMCLLLLEEYLRPGQLVYDFGSGSGILSIAAVKLGARKVYAVDVAPVAERVIRENLELNGLEAAVHFRLGSWPLFLEASPEEGWLTEGAGSADLLLGNLLASILVEALQQGLRQCVAPGGTLILSGILADHRDKVQKALDSAGLVVVEWRRIEEWLAVVATAPAKLP